MRNLLSKITEFHPSVWRYNFGIAFVVFSLFAFSGEAQASTQYSCDVSTQPDSTAEHHSVQTAMSISSGGRYIRVRGFTSHSGSFSGDEGYVVRLGNLSGCTFTQVGSDFVVMPQSFGAGYNQDIWFASPVPVEGSVTAVLVRESQMYGSGGYFLVQKWDDAVCGGNHYKTTNCSSNPTYDLVLEITDANPFGPVCGNDVVEGGEQCDDGNLDDDDGCSSSCSYDLDLTAPVITLPDLEDGFLSSDFFLAYSQTPQSAVFLGENLDLSFNDFTWDYSVFHSPDNVTYTTIKNSLNLPSHLTSFTPQYVGSTFDYLPLVGADDDYYYIVARWCVDSLGVCSDIGVSGVFQWDSDGHHIIPPPASDGSDFDRFEESLSFLPDKPVEGSITDYIVWVFDWLNVAFFGSKEAWLAVLSEYRDSFVSVFSNLGDLPPAYWVMQPITSVRSGMADPAACDYTFGISGFDLFDVCDGVDRIPHAVWFSLVVVFWVIIGYSAMYLLVGGENSSSNE